MSFITDTELNVKQQLAVFAQCHQDEQLILLVLAVVYKPVQQIPLNMILAAIAQQEVFGRDKTLPKFDAQMQLRFIDLGLINDTRDGIQLDTSLRHLLTQQCVKQGVLADIIMLCNEVVPVKPQHAWHDAKAIDIQCEFRQHLYLQEFDACLSLIDFDSQTQAMKATQNQWLIELFFYPFDAEFFCTLPGTIQYQAFAALLSKLRESDVDNTQVIALLHTLSREHVIGVDLQLLLAEQCLLRNELLPAQALLSDLPYTAYRLALSGWLSFLQGNINSAISSFNLCIKVKNKQGLRKRQHVGGQAGIFYLLALLKAAYLDDVTLYAQLFAEINHYKWEKHAHNEFIKSYQIIEQVAKVLSGKSSEVELLATTTETVSDSYYVRFALLLSALSYIWCTKAVPQSYLEKLTLYREQAHKNGALWYADIVDNIVEQGQARPIDDQEETADNETPGCLDLVNLLIKKEAWLQALDELIALKQHPASEQGKQGFIQQSRLIWMLTPQFPYNMQAKQQTISAKGWSKGRIIPLKRLAETPTAFDFLTPEDISLCQAINTYELSGRYKRKMEYSLAGLSALSASVAHPRIYLSYNLDVPLKISQAPPELMITESGTGYRIFLSEIPQDIDDWQDYDPMHDDMVVGENEHVAAQSQGGSFCFTNNGHNQYVLTVFSAEHMKIADIVGSAGLVIPQQAKSKVLESIAAVAPLLNIQSDIVDIHELQTDIEQVSASQTLYVNILPLDQGLQMECHVQPLGEQGPNLMPGLGNSTVVAQIDNKRVITHRELDVERQHLDLLVAACPLFCYMSEHQLVLNSLEDALTTLQQLEAMQNDLQAPELVLQWPLGQQIKLGQPIGQQQMQVQLSQHQDWFAIEGQLTVNDEQVLELKHLLNLMQKSPGRFVRLDDNTYITLTEQLKQQLADIDASTIDGQFHPLAAPTIDQATSGMARQTDEAWQQKLIRLKQSFSLQPVLPVTLQAELRDYQKQGFDWAYRLAHWGAGACLADDMGLGKTLQALALILHRAAQGPSLVLAPTSVCFNWQQEANRFAPTLNVKMFGMAGKHERQLMLDNAAPYDLIVCSYGLLTNEAEGLLEVNWNTLVADEAQAIKNPQAKRSKVAMALKGDFKMITTGTPLENNLMELWSLFNFINPGLLGTQQHFQQRFVNPMDNTDKDQGIRNQASNALRRVISPFILRRLKSEVLTELPSRTEVNLHVEMSPQESDFYEALRQQSVEKLRKTDDKGGQKRIKILAEIMRLRRACCHPTLVVPDSKISGSKLKVFDNLVDELKQGGHRALVFSQFVGHLSILKQHLITKGIDFQYLDGSTTPVKRQRAVEDFQGGAGDLFLISLKAGGAGLNLTAADYVIHMDPWWNPAVEDQASDRAHRMGQTRPVTIYRLISQNTIEDKIVALHQKKRDLANSLLEGTDSVGHVSLDDMMNLLKEER